MKKFMCILIALVLVFSSASSLLYAPSAAALSDSPTDEDPALVYVAEMIEANGPTTVLWNSYNDMTGIANPNEFKVDFDWRDGNESVRALCAYTARCYSIYPVNTLEKIRLMLLVLNNFENIKETLPQGVSLSIRIWESDGNQIYITEEDYALYRTMYQEALGIVS